MGSHQNGQQGRSLYAISRGSTTLITMKKQCGPSKEEMGELKVKMIRDVTPQCLCLLSGMMNSKNSYVNPLLFTIFVKIGVS